MSDKENSEKVEKNGEDKQKSLTERTPILEWIIAAIGLALVLFSIGYISYYFATSEGRPPDLIVKVESIKQISQGYLVEFKVENVGDETASNVTIEGSLKNEGENTETKTTRIDYVASRSEKRGGLLYSKKPDKENLKISALGYEVP